MRRVFNFFATIASGMAGDISMTIAASTLLWFEEVRGIDVETLTRYGIYSARPAPHGAEDRTPIPDANGDIIAFPFIDGGIEINAKYRNPAKRFMQRKGARKTFFNADVLDDPALIAGTHALVITEGEIDALSVIQAGYPFVVSVPDGAPPARNKDGQLIEVPKTSAGIEPEHDEKYSFIFNNWDRLKRIKRIVIATDADEPGQRLAEELVRRLDRVRCLWVKYPEGCKDMNEVLVLYEAAAVMQVIAGAKEYPVSGLYRLSEIPSEPDLQAVSTGWSRLDGLVKVFTPALMVITGFAGQGKSTWAEQLVANLAKNFGWVTAIASFEMRIRPYITDTLGTVLLDKPHWTYSPMGDKESVWTAANVRTVDDWIERQFVFIGPDPQNDEQEHTIEWLIDTAEAAVIRHGVRVLLIDPWNEIDHLREKGESGSDYVGRAIRLLKRFAKKFGVLVIIVAHPTKSAMGKPPEGVSLYDISDSAHFANKADIGIVVARMGNMSVDTDTMIMIKKIRYQPETGKPGSATFGFSEEKRIFSE